MLNYVTKQTPRRIPLQVKDTPPFNLSAFPQNSSVSVVTVGASGEQRPVHSTLYVVTSVLFIV